MADLLVRETRSASWRSMVQVHFNETGGGRKATASFETGDVCQAFKCFGALNCLRMSANYINLTIAKMAVFDICAGNFSSGTMGGCDDEARLLSEQVHSTHKATRARLAAQTVFF